MKNTQSRQLSEAIFDKEREARQYGSVITNRSKISSLRNKQKQFIENQNAARRDEFIRQQTALKNKQRMQQKISKYDSIMKGNSNTVSNAYLVDFEAKGIDVTMEDHEVTLMNARDKNRGTNHKEIDYDLYEDMVIDPNVMNNNSQNEKKITIEDRMKAKLLQRKNMINDAKKRKQNLMEQIKNGSIESLIDEMNETQNRNKRELRRKPVFTNKLTSNSNRNSRERIRNSLPAFVHRSILKMKKEHNKNNKKRKLSEREDNDLDNDKSEHIPSKRHKASRIDKECGYAAIPPPTDLYPANSNHNNKKSRRMKEESKREAMELIDSVLTEDNLNNNKNKDIESKWDENAKQQTFIPNQTMQHQTYHQQMPYHQQVMNSNYQYNPYLNQYIAGYMNPYQMQYQYYQHLYQQYGYPQQQNPHLTQQQPQMTQSTVNNANIPSCNTNIVSNSKEEA